MFAPTLEMKNDRRLGTDWSQAHEAGFENEFNLQPSRAKATRER